VKWRLNGVSPARTSCLVGRGSLVAIRRIEGRELSCAVRAPWVELKSGRNLTTACTRPAPAWMSFARLDAARSWVRAGDAGRYAATAHGACGIGRRSSGREGLMMRIESGKYSPGMSHPHWGLSERGRASFRDRVSFSQPFAEPPRLIVAISGLDIRNDYAASVTAEAEGVAVDGFGLRISTGYGGVEEVTLTWVAIGAA